MNEDSRVLRNWTLKEIKETRDMFKVPGLIGQPIHTSVAVSSEGEGDLHDSSGLASPHSIAPAYGNFQEYV